MTAMQRKTCDTFSEAREFFTGLSEQPGVTFSSLAGRLVRWQQRDMPMVSRVYRTQRAITISVREGTETTTLTRWTAQAWPFAIIGRLECGSLDILSMHWDRPAADRALRKHSATDPQVIDLFAMER